jgi:hypothetical protein
VIEEFHGERTYTTKGRISHDEHSSGFRGWCVGKEVLFLYVWMFWFKVKTYPLSQGQLQKETPIACTGFYAQIP